jgi:hypothetical protein
MWHVRGAAEVHTVFWWGDLRERRHLKDLDIDGRIVLKRVLKKRDRGSRYCIYLAQDRQFAGACERGDEPSSSTKCGEFVNYLSFSERTLLHGVSLFSRVADAVMSDCGIEIISMYCEEISESDYVITYQTSDRLIISSAAVP